jgi:hypothetical protein
MTEYVRKMVHLDVMSENHIFNFSLDHTQTLLTRTPRLEEKRNGEIKRQNKKLKPVLKKGVPSINNLCVIESFCLTCIFENKGVGSMSPKNKRS